MTLCPACRAPLTSGALRCKMCGSDAREASEAQGVGASFTLAGISPEAVRAADLLEELVALSPAVYEAWKVLDRPRKERVARILAELLVRWHR